MSLLFFIRMSRKGSELSVSSSYVKLMLGSILFSFCMLEGMLYFFLVYNQKVVNIPEVMDVVW